MIANNINATIYLILFPYISYIGVSCLKETVNYRWDTCHVVPSDKNFSQSYLDKICCKLNVVAFQNLAHLEYNWACLSCYIQSSQKSVGKFYILRRRMLLVTKPVQKVNLKVHILSRVVGHL